VKAHQLFYPFLGSCLLASAIFGLAASRETRVSTRAPEDETVDYCYVVFDRELDRANRMGPTLKHEVLFFHRRNGDTDVLLQFVDERGTRPTHEEVVAKARESNCPLRDRYGK
jgi:hypothetical protein